MFAELVRFLFCRKVRSKARENCLGFANASLAEGMGAGRHHQSLFCLHKADSKCSQRCSFLECHKHPLSYTTYDRSPGVEHVRFPVYLLCKHGTGDLIMTLQVESWMMSYWYDEMASYWHPWIAGLSISGTMPQWTFSLPPDYHINLLGNFSQPPPSTRLKPSSCIPFPLREFCQLSGFWKRHELEMIKRSHDFFKSSQVKEDW